MASEKQIRLNRIFGPDHRSVVIAMDHGIAGIAPLGFLAQPEGLIPEVIRGGADAVIVTPGMIHKYGKLFGRAGVILRIDGGPTALTGAWNEMAVLMEVEEALRLGADAVIMMGIAGGEGEPASLANLGRIAVRCVDWGIPLIAEMLPGGFAAKEVTNDQLCVAARLGAELGADIVKIRYQGPQAEFHQVIENCYCPILILGGSKQPPEQLLQEICQAIDAGAAGVAIGRNIWQHPEPCAMTQRVWQAVHQP